MKRRLATIAVAVAVVAIVVAAGVAVAPRIERRRSLARAIEAARNANGAECEAAFRDLAEREEPEALIALVDLWRERKVPRWPLLAAGELLACSPPPHDSRPRAAIETLARESTGASWDRLVAYELLEELDQPTFPMEPDDLANAPRITLRLQRGKPIDLAPLGPWLSCEHVPTAEVDAIIEDRPYRALVRMAQKLGHVVSLEGRRARFHFGDIWEGRDERDPATVLARFQAELQKKIVVAEPSGFALPPPPGSYRCGSLKELRALAALNGCEVRERDPMTLEIVRRVR